MVQAIPATDVDLAQLSNIFGLERSDDPQFFREWQESLPKLNEAEKQALDIVFFDYQSRRRSIPSCQDFEETARFSDHEK